MRMEFVACLRLDILRSPKWLTKIPTLKPPRKGCIFRRDSFNTSKRYKANIPKTIRGGLEELFEHVFTQEPNPLQKLDYMVAVRA
jgi:hypothetical protein